MATEDREGVVDGVRVDVVRLHETWMELLFPRQRSAEHSVLGKWSPTSTADRVKYRAWYALGVPLVAVLYPLLLLGFATRFYARRFDSATTRIGLAGTVLLAVVVWGALTALARVRLPSAEGFYAVAGASAVAVVAAGLAVGFQQLDGRPVTVLFAYPMAMTAIFLPPVVAALYDPALSGVLSGSEALADWLLDNVFALFGLDRTIREQYELEGAAYVLMWFGISVPLGWLLGGVVTLADLVRPTDEQSESPTSDD